MVKFKLLSYNLSRDTLAYGGNKPVEIEGERSIKKGDTCNTFLVSMPNHIGTHIETPRHFFERGRALTQYNINKLIFRKPLAINCPKKKCELITAQDIKRFSRQLARADMVIFKTGFGKIRSKKEYAIYNPGISPEVGYLFRAKFPNIRCIGIDSISVSCYQRRKLGREIHRLLLNKGVLIIEDMKLDFNLSSISKVIVAPLFIEKVDAAPCTVIGIFGERK